MDKIESKPDKNEKRGEAGKSQKQLHYHSNPRYVIKECSSYGTLYTRHCGCSKGNVEDKILVPKPPKNYARCTSTNVVNAPRELYVVKQDNGSFVDKIIFNLNRAPDSPNQFHCFHCKDVLRDGEACKRCTCIKYGSGLGKGLCYICGHNQNSLNDSPSISKTSSQSPPNINHCCYECGDPLDSIFCKRCTCKSCGKDAHISYNCPSKVPVISKPEPCNNQTIDELPQTLPIFHPTFHSKAESPFTLDSTPTYFNESPNVSNPPPQSPVYPCEFCRNDAYYGHNCTPQALVIYLEPCYNQDFNFPQDFQNVPQQYPCCDDCGVTHDAYQCQPMNEVYYHGQNSCYDSTFIGDEHLDTILATELNEFIKFGVETLIPIPSESEGIPEHVCDVPSHDNSLLLDVSKDLIEDFSESNEEFSSIDDDSFSIDNIDYVEASPPDSELVSSEVMEIVIPETMSFVKNC
nr:hypothetical protein [Tanacetum cinerariifolium]